MTINFRCMDKSGVNIWKTSFSFHKIKKRARSQRALVSPAELHYSIKEERWVKWKFPLRIAVFFWKECCRGDLSPLRDQLMWQISSALRPTSMTTTRTVTCRKKEGRVLYLD